MSPGAAAPFSLLPQPGRLPVRSVPAAAPPGDAGSEQAAADGAAAAPEAAEGLTPSIEGLPGDRELFQSSSRSGGDICTPALENTVPLPASERQTAEEVSSPARQG